MNSKGTIAYLYTSKWLNITGLAHVICYSVTISVTFIDYK